MITEGLFNDANQQVCIISNTSERFFPSLIREVHREALLFPVIKSIQKVLTRFLDA